MGDWCGSACADRRTDKNEITGAGRGKNDIVLLGMQAKKKVAIFFSGRGVFSLDWPFNG
ncbi:MAG: hypothetical protein KKA75_02115 [Proteobacteria bacterium]|nr:hypothetical protein [Pseudomonadota bacterium]